MSLQGSLDRISATVQRAARVPMSASCVVNRAEILALVERARAGIPVEIRDADALLARREKVLSTARDEAEKTLTEARRCAEQLAESSTIVARARDRAEEIIEAAHAEAERLRREADDYCDRQLADFSEELERLRAQAARGRERLRHRTPEQNTSGRAAPDRAAPDRAGQNRTGQEPVGGCETGRETGYETGARTVPAGSGADATDPGPPMSVGSETSRHAPSGQVPGPSAPGATRSGLGQDAGLE
ncbi:MAG: hypothetical protein QG608_2626 [Actinomycetota bacterium]|nr:hypothetical protein [Actinomycetota bacterium]